MEVGIGIMIPLMGTTLGAACVFLLRGELNLNLQKGLLGFASGVMVAASVWSLLIPAMDMSEHLGKLAFVPAAAGLLLGVGFLLLMDYLMPRLYPGQIRLTGERDTMGKLKKTAMLVFAVTLHNIPEGMAVGVAFAGMLSGNELMTFAGAVALSIGIGIQNIPEGAVVSLPLKAGGASKGRAFFMGTLSGVVEPAAAVITILLAELLEPLLPYLLAFAAGAMLYVVVKELVPEASRGEHPNVGILGFASGFVVMMVMDVALG